MKTNEQIEKEIAELRSMKSKNNESKKLQKVSVQAIMPGQADFRAECMSAVGVTVEEESTGLSVKTFIVGNFNGEVTVSLINSLEKLKESLIDQLAENLGPDVLIAMLAMIGRK